MQKIFVRMVLLILLLVTSGSVPVLAEGGPVPSCLPPGPCLISG
jgi:hypothetical protein